MRGQAKTLARQPVEAIFNDNIKFDPLTI
jgi:hypothetical protein